MNKVCEFIEQNNGAAILEGKEDSGSHLGLPYPYSVPTAVNHFREMYYWDTYFTNLGLLAGGHGEQAANNALDIMHLIKRFGFMPNGSSRGYLDRSQPPFLSLMLGDLFEYGGSLGEREITAHAAFDALETELAYFEKNRATPVGLCAWGGDMTAEKAPRNAGGLRGRTGLDFAGVPEMTVADSFIAQAESGWDFNPVTLPDAKNFVAPDLNALLYLLEKQLAHLAKILEKESLAEKYETAAKTRAALCEKYLTDEKTGVYLNYNHVTGKHSEIFAATSFYPLFAGMVSEKTASATVARLGELEAACGVACTPPLSVPGRFQWAWPNAWPPVQYIVYKALKNYGFEADAKRIASKYIKTVDSCFEETSNLWEKYNAETGTTNVTDEYKMPPMLGWTAGVYLAFKNIYPEL